jgi:DNA repair protein RecN (Recombination protein N)
MVFDEVDAGIGDRPPKWSPKIALVLPTSKSCVSPICRRLRPWLTDTWRSKSGERERTSTVVKILDDEAHLQEVTRMISGDNPTRAALDNAAEMIAAAHSFKEKWKNKAQA